MEVTSKKKSAIQATVLVGLVALVLLFINLISSRHFVRSDLTEDREYTLADATRKTVNGLEDRMIIKLYMSQDVPVSLNALAQGILDLLDEYQRASNGKIDIQRVIPELSTQTEQEAQMMGIPPLQLDVIAKDKREVRKVYLGLAITYLDKKEVIPVVADLGQLEYNLTSALLKLTTKELPRLGLVLPEEGEMPGQQGSYSFLEDFLTKQFIVEKIDSDSPDVGKEKFSALLVIEPHQLSNTFVKVLDDWVKQGTSILIFAGRVEVSGQLLAQTYQTGLEEWLKKKGIELSSSLVIDPKNHSYAAFSSGYLQYHVPYPFFVKVDQKGLNRQNPITSRLEGLMFPWTNSLILQSENQEWNYEVLAESSSASFLQEGPPEVNPAVLENLGEPTDTGKKILAVMASPKNADSSNATKSKIIVVANNTLLKNSTLGEHDANILLPLNAVDWVSWGENLIGIRSRGKTDRPIILPSPTAISIIKFVHIIGLPVAFVVFGLILSLLRRRQWAIKQL